MSKTTNLFWPPPLPNPPQFQPSPRTWTLSRYEEVQAALRNPAFRQASVEGQDTDVADDPQHPQLLADLRDDTERFVSPEWQEHMASLACTLLNGAASSHPIDLVSRVIKPWSVMTGLQFSGAGIAMRRQLGRIAERLAHAHDNPDLFSPAQRAIWRVQKPWFELHHRRAEKELEGLVRGGRIKISRAFFASATQTLPNFLSKAWFALLLHPDQMRLLRDEPERLPSAVEELLRYAGTVRSLHRRAAQDLTIGSAAIAQGDFLALKIESANRDPLHYEDPGRLDITRRRAGHLGLGVGPHACPGATIVRMALAVTTPMFLAAHPRLDPNLPVEWKGDATITWPSIIPVRLEKQPARGTAISKL